MEGWTGTAQGLDSKWNGTRGLHEAGSEGGTAWGIWQKAGEEGKSPLEIWQGGSDENMYITLHCTAFCTLNIN